MLVIKQCKFTDGDVSGGREELLSRILNTENECASLVMAQRLAATGATWDPRAKSCYAEFGDNIPKSDRFRACLFTSGNGF